VGSVITICCESWVARTIVPFLVLRLAARGSVTLLEEIAMSLLRRIGAGEDAKSIRARIPADLADALDAFDRDAKRQGFEFPRDDIVTDALRKALAKARAELDKLAGDDARLEGGSVAQRQANPPTKDGAKDGGEDAAETDGQNHAATKSEATETGGRLDL
jgi:hypothetical protein